MTRAVNPPPGFDPFNVDAAPLADVPEAPRFCESCRFWRRADKSDRVANEAADGMGLCCYNPPRAQLVPIPPSGKVAVQQVPSFAPASIRAPTAADDFCHCHTRAGEYTSDEGIAAELASISESLEFLARIVEGKKVD
jgi:hypothetical protein